MQIHAYPTGGLDVERPVSSPLLKEVNNPPENVFVRCGREHKFGAFLYGTNGLIHHFNSFSIEWKITTNREDLASLELVKSLELKSSFSFAQQIYLPREGCRGTFAVDALLNFNPKLVMGTLFNGPLKGERKGEHGFVLLSNSVSSLLRCTQL